MVTRFFSFDSQQRDNGHRHARQCQRRDFSRHQRDGETLKDGVKQDHAGADDHGRRGQHHGTEANCSGVNHRLIERHPFLQAKLNEVDQMIELRTTIPAPQ